MWQTVSAVADSPGQNVRRVVHQWGPASSAWCGRHEGQTESRAASAGSVAFCWNGRRSRSTLHESRCNPDEGQ